MLLYQPLRKIKAACPLFYSLFINEMMIICTNLLRLSLSFDHCQPVKYAKKPMSFRHELFRLLRVCCYESVKPLSIALCVKSLQ